MVKSYYVNILPDQRNCVTPPLNLKPRPGDRTFAHWIYPICWKTEYLWMSISLSGWIVFTRSGQKYSTFFFNIKSWRQTDVHQWMVFFFL